MKLIFILSAILALSLAKEVKNEVHEIEDSVAEAANIELLKEGVDLKAAASSHPYIPPSQREPIWQAPQNAWQQSQNTWQQAQNTWQQGQNTWQLPQNTWQPPKPQLPIGGDYGKPPSNVQNDYYWVTGSPVNTHPPTTTTPVPVIKQEHYIGDRGDYKYEYHLGDGTHVGEQGWYTDPKQTDESVVKKGWYSFVGADGRTYTVTYWADHTGYHAYGDHLPTPPPVPAAIQNAINQQNDEENYKPTPAPQPAHPTYAPTHPTYAPAHPTYAPAPYPSQPTYPPQQHYPSQPVYYPQQQGTYVPNYNV